MQGTKGHVFYQNRLSDLGAEMAFKINSVKT